MRNLISWLKRNPCKDCDYYHEKNNTCQSKKCATASDGHVNLIDKLFCEPYTQKEREGIEQYIDSIAEPCEDWHDIPSGEMTLEQARQAVKELRKYVMDNHILSKSEDAISKRAVLDTLDTSDKFMDEDRTVETYKVLLKECYEVLPPVNPQPKTGHWIPGEKAPIECDRCGYGVMPWNNTEYCPNCGCRMVEPQAESEGEG